MRVLVLGATGFIGRHVCARLVAEGHAVLAASRDPAGAARRFPSARAVSLELRTMLTPERWKPLLEGVDAVVNCAGVLQSGRGGSAREIHDVAPRALFDACVGAGVRKVVQISAVSADGAAGTEYAATKKAADDHLAATDLDWTVLRPSLVYASGSYGGTSAIRGLSGLPLVMPTVGRGHQAFQPVHADDVARTVADCLSGSRFSRRTVDVVGPETMTMLDILRATRAWLDLPPARHVAIPEPLVRLLARIGDLYGSGPIRTTSLDQMSYGNVSDPDAFRVAAGFRPRSMAEAFSAAPSHVQDRWHARLYFIRPAATAALAALWIGSGLAGLLNPPADEGAIVAAAGLPTTWAPWIGAAFSVVDLVIGARIATGRGGRRLAAAQFVLVGLYTLGIGTSDPALWADPYGSLLKNLPILVAIAAWGALLDER